MCSKSYWKPLCLSYKKKLKRSDSKTFTKSDQPVALKFDSDKFWQDKTKTVVNISELAKAIKDELGNNNITFQQKSTDGSITNSQFTSAQFALEMIEGVQKVRFTKTLD